MLSRKVGLGYLTLDRQSRTLSGGEVARASLTSALGSCLVNTLYVLDEPSIGLHPRDTRMLIEMLKGLRDMGNTIMIVEHDPDIIARSERSSTWGRAQARTAAVSCLQATGRPCTRARLPDRRLFCRQAPHCAAGAPPHSGRGSRLRIQGATINNLQI